MSGKEFMKWQNVNCKRGIWLTDSGTVNIIIISYSQNVLLTNVHIVYIPP